MYERVPGCVTERESLIHTMAEKFHFYNIVYKKLVRSDDVECMCMCMWLKSVRSISIFVGANKPWFAL